MNEPTNRFDEPLDRWLAGDATEEDERRLEAAAAEDDELAELLASYRSAIAGVANLPTSLAPERDLWPTIAGRIRPAAARRRSRLAIVASLAAAAALVVAVQWVEMRSTDRDPAGDRPSPVAWPARSPVALSAYAESDRQLAEVRIELRRAIERRAAELPPDALREVEENLETIERAIADIEAALKQLPADPALARTYIAYREHQVDLLRRANRLAARL
jgi:hypothetical protein